MVFLCSLKWHLLTVIRKKIKLHPVWVLVVKQYWLHGSSSHNNGKKTCSPWFWIQLLHHLSAYWLLFHKMNFILQKHRKEPSSAFWTGECSICIAWQGDPSCFIANHRVWFQENWRKSIHQLDKGEQHLLPHQIEAGTMGKRGKRLSRRWVILWLLYYTITSPPVNLGISHHLLFESCNSFADWSHRAWGGICELHQTRKNKQWLKPLSCSSSLSLILYARATFLFITFSCPSVASLMSQCPARSLLFRQTLTTQILFCPIYLIPTNQSQIHDLGDYSPLLLSCAWGPIHLLWYSIKL